MISRPRHMRSGCTTERGSILIEGLVAILIFSLGVIALIGMQTLSINESLHGKYRTDASYLANEIIGQMLLDKANVSSYADTASSQSPQREAWDDRVTASLPNGSATITMDGSNVTVVVSWRNSNETSSHSYRSIAQVVF